MTKKYLRLTLNERFQHLNLMINFTILVITGFALKYPTAFWVSPIGCERRLIESLEIEERHDEKISSINGE